MTEKKSLECVEDEVIATASNSSLSSMAIFQLTVQERKEIVRNQRVLTYVFLSDLLTVIGKYFVYFESELVLSECF